MALSVLAGCSEETTKQLPDARTGHDQTYLQRQIDATDRQIDKLVYEHGLPEEEIAVVEVKAIQRNSLLGRVTSMCHTPIGLKLFFF